MLQEETAQDFSPALGDLPSFADSAPDWTVLEEKVEHMRHRLGVAAPDLESVR